MFDPMEMIYSAFSAEAGFEEGKTPYDRIPLPPERKAPYTFKISRQDNVHPVWMFKYSTTDDSGSARTKWKIIRLHSEEDLSDGLREVFGPDVNIQEKAQSIKSDPDTVIYLALNLALCVQDPSTPHDGRVCYIEFTNRKRQNSPTTLLAYLASKLGMSVTRSTSGREVADFLEGTIPLLNPPDVTPDSSPISLDFQIQWTGNYVDKNGKRQYIRGMNKWPIDRETGLHLEEAEIKGANEPVRAQIEIAGF